MAQPFQPALMPGGIPAPMADDQAGQITPEQLEALLRQLNIGQPGGAEPGAPAGNGLSVAPAVLGGMTPPPAGPPETAAAPPRPMGPGLPPRAPAPASGDPMAGKRTMADDLGMIGNALAATDPIMSRMTGSLDSSDASNRTLAFLTMRGLDPVTAKAAMANPAVLQQVLGQMYKSKYMTKKPGERVLEQTAGGIRDVTPDDGAGPDDKTIMGRTRLASQFGLQPGTQEFKEYVLNGKVPHQAKLPSGFELIDQSDPSKGQRPTPGGPYDFARRDKINAAKTSLDSATAAIDQLIGDIDRAMGKEGTAERKGFDDNFGKMGAFPNFWGGKAADQWTLVQQLRDKGMLNAVQALKASGASLGPVSNAEGERLSNSFAAINWKASPELVRGDLERRKEELAQSKAMMQGAYLRQYGEVNQAQLLQEAQAAIGQNADPVAVRLRYIALGGDPQQLQLPKKGQ